VVAQAGEGYYKDSKAISGAVNRRLVGSGAAYAYVIRLSPGGPPRRAAPNGLELSCRASRIRFRIIRFSAAGPVSCSELLCVPQSKTRPHRHDLFHHFLHPLAPAAIRLPYRATVLDHGPPPAALPPRSG